MRHAYTAAAEYHFQHHVPRHFQGFAAAKYGYYPRTKKYNDRKLKQVGHTDPLVFTGASRREATSNHRIAATPKGSKLFVRLAISGGSGRVLDAAAAARKFAAGKRKTATISKTQVQSQIQVLKRVSEMETVAQDEINTLGRVMQEDYQHQADTQTTPYRVKIKVS
jgi:hypothetical protein